MVFTNVLLSYIKIQICDLVLKYYYKIGKIFLRQVQLCINNIFVSITAQPNTFYHTNKSGELNYV